MRHSPYTSNSLSYSFKAVKHEFRVSAFMFDFGACIGMRACKLLFFFLNIILFLSKQNINGKNKGERRGCAHIESKKKEECVCVRVFSYLSLCSSVCV